MGVGLFDLIAGLIDPTPQTPDAPQLNARADQKGAIAGNLANLPAAQELASKTNTFNSDQLLGMLRKNIPGFDNILTKGSSIISDEMSGKLPQDVQDQIQNSSAGRAVMGGFAGSGVARNLTARDLGLTSLSITQKGLDSASRWLESAKSLTTPGLFDMSRMFLTPEDYLRVDQFNQVSKFQRDQVQNQIDYQHDPLHIFSQVMLEDSASTEGMIKSVAGTAAGAAGSLI